ncbi:response regulator [Desulfosporosinus shakirovi]|uniref:response regulator n=1 Tax=Desulfosporosinus shakirovi TaxID=2885154 RepID=UPI001E48F2B7|nr:response regulator [Desulfosporosinus sp. SRJS8]MCB8814041.1 response regulator [Desulfosporosinus sp. SRJS8]
MANIMVVEDETAIADLILMNLKPVGYTGFHVSDGDEVMDCIKVQNPDLIILDVMLPGKDVFDLMKEIEPLGIPVIFLTAKEELTDKIAGLKLGADDYMAHEMRTPITAIMGYGEFLKCANCSQEESLKAIDYIIYQSERMKNMTVQANGFSMPQPREYSVSNY